MAHWTFYLILAGLAVDAVLLPSILRRANTTSARDRRSDPRPDALEHVHRLRRPWQLHQPAPRSSDPPEERISNREKLRLSGKTAAPIALIVIALGAIITSLATPVEAAGIGTFGAFIVAAIHGQLDWQTARGSCLTTLKASALVLWIMFRATIFVSLYAVEGGAAVRAARAALRHRTVGHTHRHGDRAGGAGDVPRLGRILFLCVPIFVPIIRLLGVAAFGLDSPDDLVLWFGVLYLVNMQMSLLSPPSATRSSISPASPPPGDPDGRHPPITAAAPVPAGCGAVCVPYPPVITWLPQVVCG